MAGPIGTQARVTVDSTVQGSVRLRRCKTSKVSDGASAEAVNALGEDDPVGFRFKPGAKTITLEIYAEQGKPEFDWFLALRSRDVIAITREIVNGMEEQFPVAVVSKIDTDDDDEGSHMMTVELLALSRKPLS